MNYIKTHLYYVAIIAGLILGGRVWLQEHDLRVAQLQEAKVAEQQVKDLQSQIAAVQAQAAAKDRQIDLLVAKVKTPAQAIAAIPDVSSLPLHERQAVDNPGQVSVDALPLFQELAQCKRDSTDLAACQQVSADKDKQLAAKDSEIAVLKKKRPFWKRLKAGAKIFGIGAAAGAAGMVFLLAHGGV